MKIAEIDITPELFREAFALPDNAVFIRAEVARDSLGTIRLLVASDSIPDVKEYDPIPRQKPMISTTKHDCGHITKEWAWSQM